jgi:hypothetical protein
MRLFLMLMTMVAAVAQAAGPQYESPPMPGMHNPNFVSRIGPQTYQPTVGGVWVTQIPISQSAAKVQQVPTPKFAPHPSFAVPAVILPTPPTMPAMPKAEVPRIDGAREVYPGVFLDQSLRR